MADDEENQIMEVDEQKPQTTNQINSSSLSDDVL